MRMMINFGWLVAVAGLAAAQEPRRFQVGELQAVGNVAFIQALSTGGTVKGSPYSAEAVTENTQVLADGNRIVNRSSSKQYRDSEGRERRELSFGDQQTVMITDPVAGLSYSLRPNARTAEKNAMPQVQVFKDAIGGSPAVFGARISITALNGLSISEIGIPGGAVAPVPPPPPPPPAPGALRENEKTENLGTSTIEGLLAEGTRTNTVIPAGQIGNDRPIEVVDERWYSPDLKMTIMTKHSDPRMGENVFKLTNVSRTEPQRSLFEVPADYAVTEGGIGARQMKIIQREIHPQ
jgi:hypothetical protein